MANILLRPRLKVLNVIVAVSDLDDSVTNYELETDCFDWTTSSFCSFSPGKWSSRYLNV